ncbi:hypothetical protein APSETT444_002382 [Aspergillus pseudonomiae]
MGSTQFGKFHLFVDKNQPPNEAFGGCPLTGITLSGNRNLGNLVHIAAITATCWVLLLNALVGYQFLDDGTPASLGLISASALVFFIGTGYIALDTGFNWTGEFKPDPSTEYRNIALYVLYQLFPLVCLVVFFVLEAVLVIRVLGESRPMRMFTPLTLLQC